MLPPKTVRSRKKTGVKFRAISEFCHNISFFFDFRVPSAIMRKSRTHAGHFSCSLKFFEDYCTSVFPGKRGKFALFYVSMV